MGRFRARAVCVPSLLLAVLFSMRHVKWLGRSQASLLFVVGACWPRLRRTNVTSCQPRIYHLL
jgi:hypothetical protein